MKAKTLGILAVGTVLLSTCAGMTLSAKDLESSTDSKNDAVSDKPKEKPHMDLAFCIDTTGSMQGEIDMVKTKVKDLVAKLSTGKPAPIVRVGLVAFRDRGDAYVTKVYPFSDDIDKFVKDISELQADGGGDGPEAVNEALHVSINSLAWDDSNKTAKLLFLIGDAEPHYYVNDYRWEDEAKKAIGKGIQINTLACSGLNGSGNGLKVFQEIAKLSDGQFEDLAYRQIVKDETGREKTIISSGGASYEVADAASAEWKRGAKSLSAVGKAVPMPVARARASYSVAKTGSIGVRGGMAGASVMAGARNEMMSAEMGMAAPSASAASYAPLDRKDSNLDTLMYDAAMKKAREKLKVSY
jgi:uncharacterized protein YegL